MVNIDLDNLTREESQLFDEVSEYPILMSTKDFAKVTGYSRATAYRLIEEGKLHVKHITLTKGSKPTMRIRRESLLALMLGWIRDGK